MEPFYSRQTPHEMNLPYLRGVVVQQSGVGR